MFVGLTCITTLLMSLSWYCTYRSYVPVDYVRRLPDDKGRLQPGRANHDRNTASAAQDLASGCKKIREE